MPSRRVGRQCSSSPIRGPSSSIKVQSGGHQGQSGGSSRPIRGSSSSIKANQGVIKSNQGVIKLHQGQSGGSSRPIRGVIKANQGVIKANQGGHQARTCSVPSSGVIKLHQGQSGGSSRPIRGVIKLAPAPCPHQVGRAPQSIPQGPRPPPDLPTAHEAAPRSCPPPSPHAAHGPPRMTAAAARRAGVACQLGVNQGTIRGQLGVAPESPVRHVAIKVN